MKTGRGQIKLSPFVRNGGFDIMKLVISEKPSVAKSIAEAIGANQKKNGYYEGSGYMVSWCYGHLIEMAQPQDYDKKYEKWTYESLPIIPSDWIYKVKDDTKEQYLVLKELLHSVSRCGA